MQNIQIFYGGAVMFVVTCYFESQRLYNKIMQIEK